MTEDTKAPAKKRGVILHYDVWDEDGTRHPAAPVVGMNDVNSPIREEVTYLSPALAAMIVKTGKATVPLE